MEDMLYRTDGGIGIGDARHLSMDKRGSTDARVIYVIPKGNIVRTSSFP